MLSQMLPLGVGLAIRHRRPLLAEKLKKPGNLLSMILNLVALGVVLSVQFEMLLGIPARGYVGMLLLIFASVAAGWLLGGPGAGNRTAMAMATSVRNVGVAMVIASGSFPGTQAVTAATAFALFQTVVMALVALGWGRLAVAPPATTGLEVPAPGRVPESIHESS
jgi:BASS family bile acid:Na+ symporter